MSRVIVVSNRVAVPKNNTTALGGLAVGIISALNESAGLWFGWDGTVMDPVSAEVSLVQQNGVTFATIPLSSQDYEQYYMGFSNRMLWPLFHYRLNLVKYRREDFVGYERVNKLFARKLLPLLEPNDILWIHDYHLIPLGNALRMAGVTQPIGFFLHIPFPPLDVLRALPVYERLLRYLCAYDLVGFQTTYDRRSFVDSIEHAIGRKAQRGEMITAWGRHLRADVFPIGIDVDEVVAMAAKGRQAKKTQKLRDSLGGRQLFIGVDRLDYSKGLTERFQAFGRLLECYPDNQGKVVFMQIAAPSRTDVPEYKEIRRSLATVVGQINGRFAEYDWTPIRHINKGFSRASVMGFLSIGHVGVVTPLRDGMNLVAKEFIAAQDPDDPGVLLLSQLAGAAQELDSAVFVNPYDIDGIAEGMQYAISMPLNERTERWQHMMTVLRKNDINAWRDGFLRGLMETHRKLKRVS